MNRVAPHRPQAWPQPPLPDRRPRRFLPLRGQSLSMANIRGAWRPSAAVAGCCVFAVHWETRNASWWAPLHDFAPADQLRLIEECRWLDRNAGYPGAWPTGRWE